MRIIGGKHRGLRLNPPNDLPVRPTTDMAKEALFNILPNKITIENSIVLDLFTGSGGIAIELASRGASHVDAVDISNKCVRYLQEIKKKLELNALNVKKANVFQYIEQCDQTYDLIFADPPYDLDKLIQLPSLIKEKKLLNENGLFVLEFPSERHLLEDPKPVEVRKYGNSSFAFYEF
jgi:16S rRNA (guanine966-N2)-methyltransferase